MRATVLCLYLMASPSFAATLSFEGPDSIPIGSTVTIRAMISVAPGEEFDHALGAFMLDPESRSLIDVEGGNRDSRGNPDFFICAGDIDYATSAFTDPSPFPITIEGELEGPIDGVRGPTRSPFVGPRDFELLSFTFVAKAPGSLVIRTADNLPEDWPAFLSLPPDGFEPSPNGIWAIFPIVAQQTVPEPASALLALLGLSAMLKRQGSNGSTKHRTQR